MVPRTILKRLANNYPFRTLGCRGLNFGEMMCTVSGMAKHSIFISSVQKELAEERQALKAYVEGDALLSRFFEVFLFEQLPAADRRADQVYLDQVDQCDLYLGMFGDASPRPQS